MKFDKFINESEKMDKKDEKKIKSIITSDNVRKQVIVIQSWSKTYDEEEREIEIVPKSKGLEISYNTDFYNLTNFIVDICDEYGFPFKSYDERPINTTTITITNKK